jgi:hypothetical protein
MTIDGGRTMETDAALVTHDDVHAIWINPANSNHVLIGNDGGLAVSYDMSKTWTFFPNLPVGLFYHVSYDMSWPFNVCGGMQDNYNWCGPSATRFSRGIQNYDWYQVQGGDGFVTIFDPRDQRIVITESQDGNITRRNTVTGEARGIRPGTQNVVNLGENAPGFRWHWDTPMMFSHHDPRVLLVAANRVFRSIDRGDSWTVISPDLTTNADRNEVSIMGMMGNQVTIARNDGIQSWPSIVTFTESPKQAGLLYTGTDDGVVSITRDAGTTWKNITAALPGFPAGAYVSEVVASKYDAGTVYVTVDAHRLGDFGTYVWVSTDFGATFRSIVNNLRGEVARSITEDPRNGDVLYVATETGVFLTLNKGQNWQRLRGENLPDVRVDEITIHPRDNSMIVASHGRALWILDSLSPIQEYAAAQAASRDATLHTPKPALQWKTKDDRNDEFWGHQFFSGENPPADAVIQFSLKRAVGNLQLKIADAAGREIRMLDVPANRNQPGLQAVCWDMRVQPIEMPSLGGGGGAAEAAGRRGGGGGAGGGQAAGRGGQGGRGGADAVPGVPAPLPQSGYMPANPCGGGGGGGGRGGFGGGGGGVAGPHVLPGTYNISLVVDGAVVDTKPLMVVADPAVQFTEAERKRYYDISMDLHEMHRRGIDAMAALNTVYSQMAEVEGKIGSVPPAVKTQFDTFKKDFDAVRVKFGVPPQAGGGGGGRGGGGRGGGGGAPDPENVLARLTAVKDQVLGIWETPSDYNIKRYTDVKAALPRAVTEANGVLMRAMTLSQALKAHNITLNVPAPVR